MFCPCISGVCKCCISFEIFRFFQTSHVNNYHEVVTLTSARFDSHLHSFSQSSLLLPLSSSWHSPITLKRKWRIYISQILSLNYYSNSYFLCSGNWDWTLLAPYWFKQHRCLITLSSLLTEKGIFSLNYLHFLRIGRTHSIVNDYAKAVQFL